MVMLRVMTDESFQFASPVKLTSFVPGLKFELTGTGDIWAHLDQMLGEKLLRSANAVSLKDITIFLALEWLDATFVDPYYPWSHEARKHGEWIAEYVGPKPDQGSDADTRFI